MGREHVSVSKISKSSELDFLGTGSLTIFPSEDAPPSLPRHRLVVRALNFLHLSCSNILSKSRNLVPRVETTNAGYYAEKSAKAEGNNHSRQITKKMLLLISRRFLQQGCSSPLQTWSQVESRNPFYSIKLLTLKSIELHEVHRSFWEIPTYICYTPLYAKI